METQSPSRPGGRDLNLDTFTLGRGSHSGLDDGAGPVMAGTVAPIRVGSVWKQQVRARDGKVLTREIEVIGAPTLSSPVNYRITRNDAHPHRVGKTASIRKGDLRVKYRSVP